MKKHYKYGFLALLVIVPLASWAFVGRFGGSLNTSDPEKIFIKIKNGEASTAMANGDLVGADTTADDGVTMKLTIAAGEQVTCVVAEAIAAGKFGLCQVYGFHSAVKVNGTTFAVASGGNVSASTYTGRGDGETNTAQSIGKALDGSTISNTIPMWLKLQ